jgi:hypothetical protein
VELLQIKGGSIDREAHISIDQDQFNTEEPIWQEDYEEPTQCIGSQNPALTFIELDEEDRKLLDITMQNLKNGTEYSISKSIGKDFDTGSNSECALLSNGGEFKKSAVLDCGKEKVYSIGNSGGFSKMQIQKNAILSVQNTIGNSMGSSIGSIIKSVEAISRINVENITKDFVSSSYPEIIPSSNANTEVVNNVESGINHAINNAYNTTSKLSNVDVICSSNEESKVHPDLMISSSSTEGHSEVICSSNLEAVQQSINPDDQFNIEVVNSSKMENRSEIIYSSIVETEKQSITAELKTPDPPNNAENNLEVICSSQNSISSGVEMESNNCASPKACKEMDISTDTIICSSQDIFNTTVLQPELIPEVAVGNFFDSVIPGTKDKNIFNGDFKSGSEDEKLQTPVQPDRFSLSYSPDLMAVSPYSHKSHISGCSESSSEPDNSDDENYMPTQMVNDYYYELPEEIDNKNKRKRVEDGKKLYWKKVKNSEYYQAQVSKIKKQPKGLPEYIIPGQKYITKTSDSPVMVEKVLRNNIIIVKDDQDQLEKLKISDLLYSKPRLQISPEIGTTKTNNFAFKDYGFLLSLSRQEESHDIYINKEYVHTTILKHKGFIYDSISNIYNGHIRKKQGPMNILLLAAKPMRTRKFLLALAAGIPIVSVLWIKKCIEKVFFANRNKL